MILHRLHPDVKSTYRRDQPKIGLIFAPHPGDPESSVILGTIKISTNMETSAPVF
jgi:hypothetical protein